MAQQVFQLALRAATCCKCQAESAETAGSQVVAHRSRLVQYVHTREQTTVFRHCRSRMFSGSKKVDSRGLNQPSWECDRIASMGWINVALGAWLVVAACEVRHASGTAMIENIATGLFVALAALGPPCLSGQPLVWWLAGRLCSADCGSRRRLR